MKLSKVVAVCLLFHATITGADESNSPIYDKSIELLDLANTLVNTDIASLKQGAINGVSDELESAAKSYLKEIFPTAELALGFGVPSSPTLGLLIVAPISDPKDDINTIFTQGSIYHFDSRTTVNLGLGYRRLEWDKKLLLGVNGFYDHEFPYSHGRTSIGLEARTSVGEININQYWGVTGWKSAGLALDERALGGYDIELGAPLPYMNWAKIYVREFMWDSVSGFDNIGGHDISLKAQIPTFPGLTVEAGRRSYSDFDNDNFIRLTLNLMDINSAKQAKPWFSDRAYTLSSMENKKYDKVRRENIIVKQTRDSENAVYDFSIVGI